MPKSTPERLKYAKDYREKNKEKVNSVIKDWHKRPENRERHLDYCKQYRIDNLEKIVARSTKWRKDNPEKFQFTQVKARAKKNNLAFNLVFEELKWPSICPILGIPIHRESRDNHPSFDRVIPALGYTKGNVCIISNRANRLKQESTLEQLEALVSYIKDQTKLHANTFEVET